MMLDSSYTLSDYRELLDNLPRFNPFPKARGVIRQCNRHFKVVENLTFEPSGEGEHLFLLIEKDGCNTDWVAKQLQRIFSVKPRDIGYAGKKDRYSVSQQWFSVHLPGKEVPIPEFDNEEFKLLKNCRHNRKLRLGSIKNNQFELIISQVSDEIEHQHIQGIKEFGAPNYFGYQRFGHQAGNLENAQKMFCGELRVKNKNKKGLYLSAARSFLFNLIVAKRLAQQTWHLPQVGDCLMLDGTHSYFECEQLDNELSQRYARQDIHICGWLPGKQDSEARHQVLLAELDVTKQYQLLYQGISKAGVNSSRRAMRVVPRDFSLEYLSPDQVKLEFSLPSGCFATAVLRELVDFTDAALEDR